MNAGAIRNPGVVAALGAAVLFGAGTPLAKMLLADVSPWLLAGLLYLGAGFGLLLWRVARRAPQVRLPQREWLWLAAAVVCGGIAAVHEHPYDPQDPHHRTAAGDTEESVPSESVPSESGLRHRHEPMTHEHPHYPDLHHRHPH